MRLRPTILIGLLLCLVATVRAAEACSCIEAGPACQEYWRGSAVFLGRVDAITRAPTKAGTAFPFSRRVKFTVLEGYRGVSKGEAEVQTGSGGGDCGYQFTEGIEYIVYAFGNESTGVLTTGICSRTKRASEATEDLAYARALASGVASPGRITGTVKLADRSLARQRARDPVPLPGVTVRLEKNGSAIDTATNSQGNFSAEGIAPGTYTVAVQLSPAYYAEVSPKAVELLDPNGCAEVNAVVRYDGHVSGRIVDASGRPLPGVTIDLTVPTGLDQQYGPERLRVLSDREGKYKLTHVPPGTFVVAINTERNRDGDLPQPRVFHPGVEMLAGATRVALTGGQRVELPDFVLPSHVAYTTVEGIVLGPDGGPVTGARVYLKGPSDSDYILGTPALTDGNGRFILAAINGQSYRLFAERVSGEGPTYRFDSSEQIPFDAKPGLAPVKLVLRRRY
jgi:hypothetical protein